MKAKTMTEWRKLVFRRDNYTCQICKTEYTNNRDKGGNICLFAHHIKPREVYPELRLIVENGCTECPVCHKKEPVQGKLFRILNKKKDSENYSYPSRILGITAKQQV